MVAIVMVWLWVCCCQVLHPVLKVRKNERSLNDFGWGEERKCLGYYYFFMNRFGMERRKKREKVFFSFGGEPETKCLKRSRGDKNFFLKKRGREKTKEEERFLFVV